MTEDQRELAALLLGWSDALEEGARISFEESENQGRRRNLAIQGSTAEEAA